ncbi:MAG: ISAs1 family transposase, partial [Armatimonadetes bacterium]|nr:ISAs1 family transposase [Armatimonadota bacterium]
DEDRARARKDHAAENLATIRKLALYVLKTARPDISIRRKRKRSGWSDEFAKTVIAQMR